MNPPLSRRGALQAAGATALAAGLSSLTTPAAHADTGDTAPAATTAQPGTAPGAPRSFAHPGLLHTVGDLARMKAAVEARQSPVYDGYLALAANSRSQAAYRIANTGQITTYGRGPGDHQNEGVADSAAAYQNALLWAVTGDRAHADTARDILDAWSASLTMITGADGPLGAGLQAFKFANAAELLRHTGYDGWSAEGIARCEASFLDVWYPALSSYMLYANGNWDLTAVQSLLAIGVFCDQPALFEDALRFAAAGAGNGSVPHRVVTAAGQGQESGRDQGHEQLAVGLMGAAAQVAWNQGIDLWGYDGNRILANAEYATRYNLGGDVPFTPDLDRTGKYIKTAISDKSRGSFPPIYEMYYAHYAGVRGLDAPSTRAAVFRGPGGTRVVEGSNDDFPGWGTFAYPGATAPEPAVPTPPAGVTAVGHGDGITVSWLPSVGAGSYTVARATDPEGRYEVVVTGLAEPAFTDTTAHPDHTYTYTVTAANALGQSGPSAGAQAAPGLPKPWTARDIGDVRTPGTAAFDGRRFVLEASGTSATGRFAGLPLHGDGAVTARVVWPLSSQYSTVGVTLRAGLDATAAHASTIIQGLPLATWSGVWSTRPQAGAPVTGTGSTPVPPSQQQAVTTSAGFPISDLGVLPQSATPLEAPCVEGAGDGYRLRAPYWVRVTRRGDRCTGAISPDGVRWTEVGSTRIALGHTAYAGLWLSSCLGVDEDYAETGTGAFDNVSVTSAYGDVWRVPRPTTSAADLHATACPDAVELAWTDQDLASRWTVLRSARAGGPFQVLATDVGPVGFGTRLRYRDGTGTPGATYHYAVARTNTAGRGPLSPLAGARMPTPAVPVLTSRTTAYATAGAPFQHMLRATHDPVRFTATGLPAGLTLNQRTGLVSGTPSGAGEYAVATAAGNAAGTGSGPLTLVVGTPPPAPWTQSDLGDPVLDDRDFASLGVVAIRTPGSTSYDGGTYTVRGAGVDLTVNNQGMTGQFVRRPVTGDAEITARLLSRDGGGTERVGLLMAKSLNPFDQAAGAVVTGGGTAQLMLRPTVAGASAFTGTTAVELPALLRLTRTGNTFAAALSTDDGTTWTPLAEGTIPGFGDAPYYAGLVVCSRSPLALSTARFTHVTVDNPD